MDKTQFELILTQVIQGDWEYFKLEHVSYTMFRLNLLKELDRL
ncbi:hypothetical protein JCM19236_2972 [Vibrio sp. JCM 19236]|nr:hypothetical protein JCM19236_2972 [Vibrio sp. JCM 19236]